MHVSARRRQWGERKFRTVNGFGSVSARVGYPVPFPVPPFSKYCLLNGIDEMGFLLKTSDDASTYEAAHQSSFSTLPAAAGASV